MQKSEISLENLEQKQTQLHEENAEIMQRIIAKINSGAEVSTFKYIIVPEMIAQSNRHPHELHAKEVQHKRTVKAIVDDWEVPADEEDLPQDPDPDETLYGKNKDIMDCSCKKFSDLVRINGQIVVARKYTSMLRDKVSMIFGLKFLHNFEVVNRLLRGVEALLTETPSSLKKQDCRQHCSDLNIIMADLFSKWDNIFSQSCGGPIMQFLLKRIVVDEPDNKPHRLMINQSNFSQGQWDGNWPNSCKGHFWGFKTQQPGTIRIVVGEADNPPRMMINHSTFSQDQWDAGQSMTVAGWKHKFDFWVFKTPQPGTMRIAVGEAWNPHRIMINHNNFSQDQWDAGQSMTVSGWKHKFDFWVFPFSNRY